MGNNLNLELTVQAWADIVIKKWRQKIIDLNIGESGQLFDSFVHEIISNSGGKPERIKFAFEYYGKFVDMGVGKEMSLGNPGDVQTRRKAKKWYSSVLYSQAQRLREILAEKYGILGAGVIVENIMEDEKKSASKGSKTYYNPNKRTALPPTSSAITELDRVWMRRNGLL